MFHKIPHEVLRLILDAVLVSLLLPPAKDDLINNLKLLTDDCELAAAYKRAHTDLCSVCREWQHIIDDLPHPFLLLPSLTSELPSAFRVQFPTACECRLQGCPMSRPPPLTSYKPGNRPMVAFLDASAESKMDVEDIIAKHTELWLLSIAVDFSSFSLPVLSSTCRRLTHLSFSEFYLPDSDQDQTLDLPMLDTLILNFFSPGETTPPKHPSQPQIHRSYKAWRLPNLRNLSLTGWVSNPNPDRINDILRNVGPTLQGLLYKLWSLPDTGSCGLHSLPPSLWDWCPLLHTIQTPLATLLAAPIPPPTHPRLTFVPVHLGDLDELPPYVIDLVWPENLFQEFRNSTSWPIDIIRISTTWATFHRKLHGIHERLANPNPEGQINQPPTDWASYFYDWANVLLSKGYTIEDRNGASILQGDGKALLLWLRSLNAWYPIDSGGAENRSVHYISSLTDNIKNMGSLTISDEESTNILPDYAYADAELPKERTALPMTGGVQDERSNIWTPKDPPFAGVSSLGSVGLTRTRAPGPVGQFRVRQVKPLARCLIMLYLRAQWILQLARSVYVFHMQSVYISRQALHLVILLNDVVDMEKGPDEAQCEEGIELEDDLIDLSEAMKEWGAAPEKGMSVDYSSCLLKINQHYTQIFKERFYFHDARILSEDLIFQKLVAYDERTIQFRNWRHNITASPVDLETMPGGYSLYPTGFPHPQPQKYAQTSGVSASFSGKSDGDTDSDDTDEAHSSPTGSSCGSNIEMPLQLQLDNAGTSQENQGSIAQEMSNGECEVWNATPHGPEYTCAWSEAGVVCGKTLKRADLFRYHVQDHFGLKPYACVDSAKVTPELKCDHRFSSLIVRDTHVKNKDTVTCDCNTKVLPKNMSRHRQNCSICSNLRPKSAGRSNP